MTDAKLNLIEQRAASATANLELGDLFPTGQHIDRAEWPKHLRWSIPPVAVVRPGYGHDASLFAHARADVSALVAEVRRLRAALQVIVDDATAIPLAVARAALDPPAGR